MQYFYDSQKQQIRLTDVKLFDIKKTFECGQCFRFDESSDGSFRGIAFGKEINLIQKDTEIILYPTTEDDYKNIWKKYFDIDRDYASINETLSYDKTLNDAISYGKGIRILNQDPWEALCSFIISQNNNIPRIKGIIGRLCENFGEKISETGYSFPTADILANLSVEDLAPLRCGFRAKYILDAAKKVSNKEVDLEKLKKLNADESREILTSIYGVGNKVADCTLLFGLGHINVCPVDVWIKKALTVLFNGSFPQCAENYAGIAQQYIFYYARETKLNI